MVVVGRVVVLPTGVADAGRDHSVAVAQQLLRGPEAATGQDRGLGVLTHWLPSLEVTSRLSRQALLIPPEVPTAAFTAAYETEGHRSNPVGRGYPFFSLIFVVSVSGFPKVGA